MNCALPVLRVLPGFCAVEDVIRSIPTHVDFEGQRLAERIYQVILTLSGIVGFLWGFLAQQFSITVYFVLGGFLLSCMLVLPPWPFYRQHPVNWARAKPEETQKGDRPAAVSRGKAKQQ